MRASTLARIAAVLLVVSAVLFVGGAGQESDDEQDESTEETHGQGEAADADESAEQREAEGHDEAVESGGEEREILGLDPESPGLVTVAVVVSLALAAGLWFTAKRGVAAAAAAFALVFAVLDVAEVSHQLDEDRNGLASLAVSIAIGHALAALTAGRAAMRPDIATEVS
jgi:hypothetical protein